MIVATGELTNFTFDNKPVGEYNVTVVKDGYDTRTETVTLTKDATELVSFTLVQQVGTLTGELYSELTPAST